MLGIVAALSGHRPTEVREPLRGYACAKALNPMPWAESRNLPGRAASYRQVTIRVNSMIRLLVVAQRSS